MPQPASIYVYAHWKGFKTPQLMGILSSSQLRGKEIFSFEYEKTWLASNFIQVLDPGIQYVTGLQYFPGSKIIH